MGGFFNVNEAAKHFSTSQMESVEKEAENFQPGPLGTRGGRRGVGEEGAQLAGAELSREFICSHGNPKVPWRGTWELG